MYSPRVVKQNSLRYQKATGRPLKRYTVEACHEAVKRLNSLLDPETGELDRKKRPNGLLKGEREFIRNEIHLCRIDFVYWCERYVKVRHWQGGHLVYFALQLAQQIVMTIWGELEEKGFAVACLALKARQLGMSTLSEIAIAHRVIFWSNINAIVGSSDPEKSKLMSKMMEICWDNLPWWMAPVMTARRAGQLFEFNHNSHNSGVSIQHGSQVSGIARGTTTSAVHLSELADFEKPGELIDASLKGAAHESPDLFLILESTAKGRDNWLHDEWRNSKENWPRTMLRPVFLPWFVGRDLYPTKTETRRNPVPENWEPKITTIRHAEKAQVYVTNYLPLRRALGKDWTMPPEQMWWWECKREEAIKKKNLAGFLQEYPADDIEAFQSTNTSAFDTDLVAEIRDTALATVPAVYAFTGDAINERHYPDRRDVQHNAPSISVIAQPRRDIPAMNFELLPLKFESYQEDPNGRLYIWEHPIPGEHYAIGADTSDGIGQDRSVLQVLKLMNPYDPNGVVTQVGEYASAIVNARDLWPLALALGTYYTVADKNGKVEQIRLVVECNGNGEIVQYELIKLGWWNFHPWKFYDNKNQRTTNKIGWFTNFRTRSMAVDTIVTAIRDEWLVINSPWFAEEMGSFERDEFRQSLRAGHGAHDDRIMSMAFALTSSYIDEITTDGRTFFTSRKKQAIKESGAVVSAAELTAELLRETLKRNNPYEQSGHYNPY